MEEELFCRELGRIDSSYQPACHYLEVVTHDCERHGRRYAVWIASGNSR